jgi:uncharacterized protein YbcI
VASHEAPSHRGEAAQAISNAVVRLLRDYTGRRDTLLKGERILVNDGHTAAVIDMRRRFQQTMREDLIAAVVEHTGREVVAFLSDHHVDPDIAAEVFILKPRPASERIFAPPSLDGAEPGPVPES